MHVWWCRDRDEFEAVGRRPELWDHLEWVDRLATRHAAAETFTVDGSCWPCGASVAFEVGRGLVGLGVPAGHPNWRETLRCPQCRMNNRRRATCRFLAMLTAGLDAPDIYLMEATTPVVPWVRALVTAGTVATSEYVADLEPSSIPEGVRHEDVHRLTWDSESFDIVVSSDVLEHVERPDLALGELRRVLRPGGTLILNVPFKPHLDGVHQRAAVVDGELVHLDRPIYHGHPLRESGSLVFTDFGWGLVDRLRQVFADVGVVRYWSERFGHFGGSLWVFVATA
jgi:SAM-dependent methyltransferase